MTILLFNGSPRKQGNTACLLRRIKEGAAQAGAKAAYMKAFLDRLYCWYRFSEDRRSWTSRLAPGKRAAAVTVGEQEKPEYLGFALEAMALPLKDLGFSLKGTLLAAGFLRAGSVKKDLGLMEKALALGIELARE